jgi:hypothetical protein
MLSTSKVHAEHMPDRFLGGVLDTVAQRSVIGIHQARAYFKEQNVKLPLTECCASFIFGDQISRGLGRCQIPVQTPTGLKGITTHLVRADLPFLVGLYAIYAHGWNVLTVEN